MVPEHLSRPVLVDMLKLTMFDIGKDNKQTVYFLAA